MRQLVQHNKSIPCTFLRIFPTGFFGVLSHGYTDKPKGECWETWAVGAWKPTSVVPPTPRNSQVNSPTFNVSGSYPSILSPLYKARHCTYCSPVQEINKERLCLHPVSIYFLFVCVPRVFDYFDYFLYATHPRDRPAGRGCVTRYQHRLSVEPPSSLPQAGSLHRSRRYNINLIAKMDPYRDFLSVFASTVIFLLIPTVSISLPRAELTNTSPTNVDALGFTGDLLTIL